MKPKKAKSDGELYPNFSKEDFFEKILSHNKMSASFTHVRRDGRYTGLVAGQATVGQMVAPSATLGPRLAGARTSATDDFTTDALTVAQVLSGLAISTPGAALTLTSPTAVALAVAYENAYETPIAGDAVEFTLINRASTDGRDITLSATFGAITGFAVVNAALTTTPNAGTTSGTFRFVFTGVTGAEPVTAATGIILRMK